TLTLSHDRVMCTTTRPATRLGICLCGIDSAPFLTFTEPRFFVFREHTWYDFDVEPLPGPPAPKNRIPTINSKYRNTNYQNPNRHT
ncbi:hypothetical protein J1N35_007466, partial [Gossypium stocksii]